MTNTRIDNRKDLLLLLLYSPGRGTAVNEPVVGRTRLVKMLYLFRREALPRFREGTAINEENFYEFFPWKFGPYSQQVFDDLEFFRLRKFIDRSEAEEADPLPESAAEWQRWLSASSSDSEEESVSEYTEESFKLTESGAAFSKQLFDALSANQRQLLREFKRRTAAVPLRALLKYVYETYPEDTVNSKIKDQVLES